MRARVLVLLVAAMLIAAGCGSSDTDAESEVDAGAEEASAEDSSDEEEDTTTTEEVTTTTEATTTTTEATTTTTAGDDASTRGVIDLRELGIEDGLLAINDGYQQVFGPADLGGDVDDGLLPAPCGNPYEFEFFQRSGFGYVYPVEELGWPDDGVIYDIILTAHQVLFDDSTIAADLRTRVDSCIGAISWPLSPSGAGGWLARTDTPQIDGIDDAQMYVVVNDTDGIVWLQYAFSVDDLGGILLMAGASPLDLDVFVTSLANPIVELAQQKLLDCLATPKCRDFNNN